MFNKVSTLAELNEFLAQVGGFHDGIIKEIHWVNDQHIDSDLSMVLAECARVRILIQTQFRQHPAVELVLEDAQSFSINSEDFVYDSVGKEVDGKLVLEIGSSQFLCSSFIYTHRPDWLGEDIRFGTKF